MIEGEYKCQHNKSAGDSFVGPMGKFRHRTQNELFFNQLIGNSDNHQLHFSSQHVELLSFIKDFQNVVSVDPNSLPNETLCVTSCIKAMKKTSLQFAETVKMGSCLSEGNLISLSGDVLDVHFFHPYYSNRSYQDGTLTNIYEGVNSVCIHLCENHHMVG